tara:strand:- start:93 stop:527 length:435 start_codon:yes stop_codon:yes gene_type:complete
MDNLLFTAPDGSLPEQNSPAYELLIILADGNKYARDHLCNELGGGFRAYLQQLTGGYYQHWLIHSEQGEYDGKKQAFYWLDERHFSCDWEQDKDARTIARKQYKDRSYYGSKNAVQRLKEAEREKADADKEYQQRIESKKPTEC